ncbi:MAG: transposase [Bacteroidia bacterium]
MKKTALRVQRVFSEELRKELVARIESGHLSVAQAMRDYDVSGQSIYNWLNKYSRNLKRGTRIVMEKDSVEKSISDLQRQIRELEAALGRKTLESDLYKTIVDLASKEYKTDLKKNYGKELSNSSREEQ